MLSQTTSQTSQSSRRVAAQRARIRLLPMALLPMLAATSISSANPNSSAPESLQNVSGIEEITVLGTRRGGQATKASELPNDPLRERIILEIQQLNQLEQEFEWRLETSRLEIKPPRVRFGYDPRNELRAPGQAVQTTLPLDITQPATIFSVDF